MPANDSPRLPREAVPAIGRQARRVAVAFGRLDVFGSFGGRVETYAALRAIQLRAASTSAITSAGIPTYSRKRRPVGSKGGHPAARRSARSFSGRRTTNASSWSIAVMLLPTNAAGYPNILRSSIPSTPAITSPNRSTSSGSGFLHELLLGMSESLAAGGLTMVGPARSRLLIGWPRFGPSRLRRRMTTDGSVLTRSSTGSHAMGRLHRLAVARPASGPRRYASERALLL